MGNLLTNLGNKIIIFYKNDKTKLAINILVALTAIIGFFRAQLVHKENKQLFNHVQKISEENHDLKIFYENIKSKRVYHNSQHKVFHYLNSRVLNPEVMLTSWKNDALRTAFQDLSSEKFLTGYLASKELAYYKGIDTLSFIEFLNISNEIVQKNYVLEYQRTQTIPATVKKVLTNFLNNEYVYDLEIMADEWGTAPFYAIKNNFDLLLQASHNTITYMDKLEMYFYQQCDTFTYRNYAFRK